MQNNYKKSFLKKSQYEGRKWKKCVCHLCDKLHHVKDVKVRDHCQMTGKYRISAHQKCNVKKSVILNGMEKYIAFFSGEELDFIVCM